MRRFCLLLGALALPNVALAGDGTKPAGLDIENQILIDGITQAFVVEAGNEPVAVLQRSVDAPTNPEGITVARGGQSYFIQRSSPGLGVGFNRAEGGPDGSVFVLYTKVKDKNVHEPHLRKVKPDLTLGFDQMLLLNDKGALSPGADGGVIHAAHKSYPPPGSFAASKSKVQIRHFASNGDLLWHVETAEGDIPNGNLVRRVEATRSTTGFYLGYAMGFTGTPVIEHRSVADGSTMFVSKSFMKPATGANVSPGTVGDQPMTGRIAILVMGSDGTAIAGVVDEAGGPDHIVRVDAAGVQTQAYKCVGNVFKGGTDEVACWGMSDTKMEFVRYGVTGGKLVARTPTSATLPDGLQLYRVKVLNGKQVLATGVKGGKLVVALFGSDGVMQKQAWGSALPQITALGVVGGKWLLYGPAENGKFLRAVGSVTPTTTPTPTRARPTR